MRHSLAIVLALLAVSALACGFLEDNADVTYDTEIPVEFTIDASELCQRTEENNDVCSREGEASQEIELPPIEQAMPLDIVEATGRQELEEASGRFKEITIRSIDYQAKPNDLTFSTPRTDVHLGPMSAEAPDSEGAFKLTTIPSVPAETEKSGEAPVDSAAQSNASDLFKELEMAAILRGQPTIKEGDSLPPDGKAEMKLTLNVRFVANPVDAANND